MPAATSSAMNGSTRQAQAPTVGPSGSGSAQRGVG